MSASTATALEVVSTPTRRVEKTVPKTSHKRKPSSVKKTAVTMTYAQFERLTVIAQIRRALMPGARLSALIGILFGGFIPVAVFSLVHFEVAKYPVTGWVMVAAGLAYSAPTVFKWAKAAFGDPVKAVGFVVLLEGIMTFSHIDILRFVALALLIFVNAVATACSLQVRKEVKE